MPSAPTLTDLTRFVEGILAPITEGFRQATAQFSSSIGTLGSAGVFARPRPIPKTSKECCWEGQDPCHCACCIVDADLVIYARLGERRVVPMTMENQWRRERQIKLELSNWSTRGGTAAPQVNAQLLPPAPNFTLGPCATETIVMVVESEVPRDTGDQQGAQRRLPDVDDCTVYYADLRVEGCEIRPVRIALALLPRDCGAFPIVCGCSPCC
jgi:hypothetical protein